ncbi:MAG: hypothetical protein LUF85_16600 [Bacteroides sp.]|nr:hypothetical protein [Bacteroides sp.]
MRKTGIIANLVLALPLIVFAQTAINDSMVGQRTCRIHMFGEEVIAPVYLKNDIPMIPVEAISFGFPTQIEINHNEVTTYNKRFWLTEAPDTINNKIFVPADFVPKVINMPVSMDLAHHMVAAGFDMHSIHNPEVFDLGSITLTESCILYTKVGLSFYIGFESLDVEGDITFTPDNVVELIDEKTFTPIIGPMIKVWTVIYDDEGRKLGSKEEVRQRKPETTRSWHFEAKEAGECVIVFRNKEFKIQVFDNDVDSFD